VDRRGDEIRIVADEYKERRPGDSEKNERFGGERGREQT
jgi:hypothetical protein